MVQLDTVSRENGGPSRTQRTQICSDRDVWLAMVRKLPGSAVVGNASEDRPVMGTAHILVFFPAGSPEFLEQDGFRNRSQAGVGRS